VKIKKPTTATTYRQRRNRNRPMDDRLNIRIPEQYGSEIDEIAGAYRKRADVVREILGIYLDARRQGKPLAYPLAMLSAADAVATGKDISNLISSPHLQSDAHKTPANIERNTDTKKR
jgi:Arc/MetJ-type ribon-helix-helix transcriptional regulator